MSIFDRFKNKKESRMSAGGAEYMIVGLGNPGKKYEYTRHNVGFMAVDLLAEKCHASVSRLKYKSLCGDGEIAGKRVLFMKPQTFMNLSGEAIRDAASFYKIPPQKIIVIFDDAALDFSRLRIRRRGSDGGHNGLKSIIYQLNSDEFVHIKIGVGAPPHAEYDLADWVLKKLSDAERSALKETLIRAGDAAQTILTHSVEEAMQRYNTK